MKNEEQEKKDWQTPEIIDLDIDKTEKFTHYTETSTNIFGTNS